MHRPRPAARPVPRPYTPAAGAAGIARVVLAALLLVSPAPVCTSPAQAAPDDAPKPGGAPAAPDPNLVRLDRFFRGKITHVETKKVAGAAATATTIEIRYDFSSPDQLLDFEPGLPFRAIRTIAWELKNGRVDLEGTGSMKHRAVFDADVSASATLTPRKARDFGFAVTEARESEVFTLYCLYDKYFSAGDNVFVPQNMIIKFIPRDPKVNKDGVQDWRYCGSRGQSPVVRTGQPYKVEIGRDANESRMTITAPDGEDFKSGGKEWDRDLTSMIFGVYCHDSHVEVDDVVIRGRLDPEFVRREKLDVTGWTPPAEPVAPPPAPAGPAQTGAANQASVNARRTIDGYPLEAKPVTLAQLIRDVTVPLHLRTEAAEKATTVALKKVVPFLVEGLYSPDADSRRLSFEVIKALTGRSFGFRAEASEDSRKRGIKEINDFLAKNAAEYT